MKNLKKFLGVAFALILGIAAVSCGKKDEPKDPVNPDDPTPAEHVCNHKCEICGKCTDASCTDPVCADKCPGHTPAKEYDVEAAKELIFQQERAVTDTTATYELNDVVAIGEDEYPVAWSIEVAQGGDPSCISITGPAEHKYTVAITRNKEVPSVDTTYTLKYRVTDPDGNDPQEGSFTRRVPVFTYATVAEIRAACDAKSGSNTDDSYDFRGIVTCKGKLSSGKIQYVYVQGESGGIIAYNLTCASQEDYDKMALGSEILVSGKAVLYSGTYEFAAGCTYELLHEAPADYKPTYKNIDDVFEAATNRKADLVEYQSQLVCLTNVTIGTNNTSNNYLYFDKGGLTEAKGNAAYFRASSSNNYLTNDAFYSFLNDNWVKGYKADIAGIMVCYSGEHYLMPVYADETNLKITSRELTDEVKCANTVDEVIASVFADTEIVGNKEFTLPAAGTTHTSVAVTYSVPAEAASYATIAENKLTIIGEAENTLKVTVTATLNDKVVSKEVTLTIKLPQPITIAEFKALKDTNNFQYVQGIVVAVNTSADYKVIEEFEGHAKDSYIVAAEWATLTPENQAKCQAPTKGGNGSFVLADKTGALFSYDKCAVQIGDEVLLKAKYGVNNQFAQFAGSTVLSIVSQGNDKTGKVDYSLQASDIIQLLESKVDATAKKIVDADLAEIAATYGSKLFKVTGYVGTSGSYINFYADEAKQQQAITTYLNNNIKYQANQLMGDKGVAEAVVYGFVRGLGNNGEHPNMQMQVLGICAKGQEIAIKPFDQSIVLTGTNLGLTNNYTVDKDVIIGGVTFHVIGTADYGDGIQMRVNATTGDSTIYNTTALNAPVKKIIFNWTKTSKTPADKANILTVEFANNASFTSAESVSVSTTTTNTVYEAVTTLNDATFVRISRTHSVSGTVYFESFEFVA